MAPRSPLTPTPASALRASAVATLTALAFLLTGCFSLGDLLVETETEAPSAAAWTAMLDAVNDARAQGRTCGGTYYEAAPPVAWNDRLARAARRHTEDMRAHDFFDHVGSDGSRVDDRVEQEGYDWQRVGENIARYQRSVDEVVAQWLASPGHCANLMHPSYVEFGAAEGGAYWTQVFGRARG